MAFLPAMHFEALNLQKGRSQTAHFGAVGQLPSWQRARGLCRRESCLGIALMTGCVVRFLRPTRGRCLASPKRTELLVDGDANSIEEIEEAIRCLKDREKGPVKTTIFAAPERAKNKKWGELFGKPSLRFQSVPRLKARLSKEPNDAALLRVMTKLSSDSKVKGVALLTLDADFLDLALELKRLGKSFRVLVPNLHSTAILRYEKETWVCFVDSLVTFPVLLAGLILYPMVLHIC